MNENPYQSPSVSAVKEQTPAEKIAQHERKITRRFIYAGLILGIAAFSYEGCNMLKEYEHKRKFQQREEQNKKDKSLIHPHQSHRFYYKNHRSFQHCHRRRHHAFLHRTAYHRHFARARQSNGIYVQPL